LRETAPKTAPFCFRKSCFYLTVVRAALIDHAELRLATLVEYRSSKMKNYVIAGPNILGRFEGASFIPGQLLVERMTVLAREPLPPSNDALHRR
jgi:hypothetical protein